MKPLFYIIKKYLKNSLLELKRKPGKLITYIVFIGFLILTLVAGVKGGDQKSIVSTEMFGSVAMGIVMFFTLPEVLAATNSGANFFRGADINLVFTAPIKSQNVLIYGFIKQMGSVFLSLFFLLFQAPNLYRFSNVKSYGLLVLLLGMFLLLLVNSVLKMLLYVIGSKSDENRSLIKNIFKVLGFILVIIYFAILFQVKSPGKAVSVMLSNEYIKYIPIYGWIREILMMTIRGISSLALVYTILTIAIIGIGIFILYSMDLDYYEDVLSAAEKKEEAITASRRGERVNFRAGKKPLTRKVQYTKKGKAATAIFYRHILEYRKTGFGFINIASVIYAVLAISVGLFFPVKDIKIVLGFTIYLLFIFSFASKWQQELTKPYIFLIPDSAFKKVIYATAVDNIKNLVDGSIVFIITGIMFKSSVISIILSIAAYVSIGALFVYGGVLSQRLIGKGENVVLSAFLKMGLLLLAVAPGIVVFIVLSTVFASTFGNIVSYLVLIGYNLIVSSVIILLGKGIFENIELS
jgi:hypothetical protein